MVSNGITPYIRMVLDLVKAGMSERKALTLVANASGIDWHILSVLYNHREELHDL